MNIKKFLIGSAAAALMFGTLATGAFAATPSYNILGTWTFNDVYGVPYAHTMVINSFNPITGDFSGYGSYNADTALTWTITGNEDGNAITFHLLTGGDTPGVTLDGTGTVASATSMSGAGSQSNIPGYPSSNVTWNATHATTTCTHTGFKRDGIDLTAALIDPATVTGDVDATGCNIGVYYGPGNSGTVNGADIFGANYYGVVVQQASVDVTNSNIHNIGEFPFNGDQHGVGVYYANVDGIANGDCTTGPGLTSGTVDSNNINFYQKGGVVVTCQGADVSVTNNTVTGLGPVDFIAQNGIEFGYGAMGTATGNTLDGGNYYTGNGWTSTALLLFDVNAKDVKTSNNKFIHNQTNLAVITAQACPHMYGGFYQTYDLCTFK